MAGTLTISTLSDGTNSTSATNCIQGSAKAWVNFNGNPTATIRASYNCSSVTRNATGQWTINFTNALADANYSTPASNSYDLSSGSGTCWVKMISQSTTAVGIGTINGAGSWVDSSYVAVACFR